MRRGVGRWPGFRCLGWCSLALDQRPVSLQRSGAALSPRRATHFSLSRQRNLRKRKATRSLGPFASLRAPCGAQSKRGLVQTRLRLRQARSLIRSLLRSSAHPGRVGLRMRIRGALSPLRALNDAMFLIAACAEFHWAIGLKA
jgi:hypothetical protein